MNETKKIIVFIVCIAAIFISGYWLGITKSRTDNGAETAAIVSKFNEILANNRDLTAQLDRAAKENSGLTARIGDLEKTNSRLENEVGELGELISSNDALLQELRSLDREREQIIRDLLEGAKSNTKTP